MPAATKSKPVSVTSRQIFPVDYQFAGLPVPLQVPSTSPKSSKASQYPQGTPAAWNDAVSRDALPTRNRRRAPKAFEVPAWLSNLTVLQRGSTLFTFTLVAGVLAVYGWSVYCQRAWSQAYGELSHLQRQERELIAASETRKQQIVLQAESPQVGLVRQVPANTVFLQPEPLRHSPRAKPKQPAPRAASEFPLGY